MSGYAIVDAKTGVQISKLFFSYDSAKKALEAEYWRQRNDLAIRLMDDDFGPNIPGQGDNSPG